MCTHILTSATFRLVAIGDLIAAVIAVIGSDVSRFHDRCAVDGPAWCGTRAADANSRKVALTTRRAVALRCNLAQVFHLLTSSAVRFAKQVHITHNYSKSIPEDGKDGTHCAVG